MQDPEPGLSLPVLFEVGGAIPHLLFALSVLLLLWTAVCQSAVRSFRWSRLEKLVGDPERLAVLERDLRQDRDLADSLGILRLLSAVTALFLVQPVFYPAGPAGPQVLELVGLVVGTFLAGLLLIDGVTRGLVRAAPERVLLATLPGMRGAERLVRPLRWFVNGLTRVLTRAFGLEHRENEEEEEVRDDILDAVSEGEHGGAIGDDEREMIESVIEFRTQQVSEIMTPRTEVTGISVDTPVHEAVSLVVGVGHSRIPVFEGGIDNVLGILYAKDLLGLWSRREDGLPPLRDLIRKPLFVPETKKILELLRELRLTKVHMAVVLDEYGGMSGLVTIEDILEEIVGDIEDEYDQEEDVVKLTRISDREVEVSARIDIEELNEALNITLPDEGDYETLGGFLFTMLGRVPHKGEVCNFNGVTFEVVEADDRRITKVKVLVDS